MMRVEDYYTQGRRGWVRLHVKGSKRHETPRNHNLEAYLDAYINAAGIAGDLKGYLFRSSRSKTRRLTSNPLAQADVYRMIRRRATKGDQNADWESPSIYAMEAGGSWRSKWLRTNRPEPRRCMIGEMMKWQ